MFYLNLTLKFEIGKINKVIAKYDTLALIN